MSSQAARRLFFNLSLIAALLTLALPGTGSAQSDDVPKFEIGGQISVLSRNKPTPIFSSPTVVPDDFDTEGRWGGGARFTYNLTNNIALEAEGNFLPKNDHDQFRSGPDGSILQGQFGVKAGKRWSKAGLFGKVRPGFVRFSEVTQLTGTHEITFMGQQYTVGDFRTGSQNYFSTDVGGVLEFYPSCRTVARFDVGDTIIRYSEFHRESFILSVPFLTRPAETKHNLQFSAGFGFRF